MNDQRIAILVDSGSDVPKKLVEKYNMYVAPLNIIYKEGEYVDGIDISAEEVYTRLEEEIPSTSLPTGSTIQNLFDKIKTDGYNKVLAITISSGLSGTYNIIRMLGKEQDDLEVFVLDTKNITMGSGFNAIQAAEYIKDGMDWETLTKTVSENIENSKVFFTVATLEYLQKGGRIGLVASTLGTRLNLKPIISCNEDGIYYTVAKIIGEKRAFNRALSLAVDYIGDSENYNIGILHAASKDQADSIRDELVSKLPNYNILVEGEVSAALGVHTGPGAIAIAVQKI